MLQNPDSANRLRPCQGIKTDAAHSVKRHITEYQSINLCTGERIFYKNLGSQTVNIGEFLAVVEVARYIIETDFRPRVIYTDSMTALTWFEEKATGRTNETKSCKKPRYF